MKNWIKKYEELNYYFILVNMILSIKKNILLLLYTYAYMFRTKDTRYNWDNLKYNPDSPLNINLIWNDYN